MSLGWFTQGMPNHTWRQDEGNHPQLIGCNLDQRAIAGFYRPSDRWCSLTWAKQSKAGVDICTSKVWLQGITPLIPLS